MRGCEKIETHKHTQREAAGGVICDEVVVETTTEELSALNAVSQSLRSSDVIFSQFLRDIDWVDLPDDNYNAVLGYKTQKTLELDALILKYNEIPKDQVDSLSCRIRKLDEIISYVNDWVSNNLQPIDKKKHLIWILEIAARKRNYLVKVFDIFENKLYEDEVQKGYHTDSALLYDTSKMPVILNNQRFFSLKLREYWGDFWYETLDPCHRRLTPFLGRWEVLKDVNPEIPHFFYGSKLNIFLNTFRV